MSKHFLLIASQGNGNALLRGLLNAHSQMDVLYQWIDRKRKPYEYLQWDNWLNASKEAEKQGLVWGNDIVFQPILDYVGADSTRVSGAIIPHIPDFKIIWSFRRKGKLEKKHLRGFRNWDLAIATYLELKDAHPDRVIWVSFEDVLLRTHSELRRICDFLEVEHEETMLEGLKDTGNPCFDYGKILKEKV